MEPLTIDLEWLANALEDHSNLWYLDLRSGEVIPENPDAGFDEEDGVEDMGEHPEIYLHITPRPSHEGFAAMEEFTDGLPEGAAKRALIRVLDQPKPFRHFKDALFNFPAEQEAWFKFSAGRLQEAAIRFLKIHSVPWTKKERSGGSSA